MEKGIIYLMTTAVPGLIKIGKTGINNYEQRMYDLESNGYRNITSLKRQFAIEVDDYSDKEALLHTIFEKSQVLNTELFALDINVAIQLLSSFEGKVIYPKNESKETIFDEATDSANGRLVPDGVYTLKRKKKSDNKTVNAKVVVKEGNWILQKGSILGITEDIGVSKKARIFRQTIEIDEKGSLLEDTDLGRCSPSFAGEVVLNQSDNGWADWKNANNESIDIYRTKTDKE